MKLNGMRVSNFCRQLLPPNRSRIIGSSVIHIGGDDIEDDVPMKGRFLNICTSGATH